MNLFIRLKSNPRYCLTVEGLLKDTSEYPRHVRRKPKDGFHILSQNKVDVKIPVETLIAEISFISENRGVSLVHG